MESGIIFFSIGLVHIPACLDDMLSTYVNFETSKLGDDNWNRLGEIFTLMRFM